MCGLNIAIRFVLSDLRNKNSKKEAAAVVFNREKLAELNRKSQGSGRREFLRRLALNKWRMSFVGILAVLSIYMGLDESGPGEYVRNQVNEASTINEAGDMNEDDMNEDDINEVLYVSDELPYEIQKVSGDIRESDMRESDISDKKSGERIESVGILDGLGERDRNKNGENDGENNEDGEYAPDALEYSIKSDSDFFINYRMEREKVRSRQLEMLQQIIDDENSEEAIRSEAQGKIMEQAEAIESELMLENILVARYGGEAAVFIQSGKVNLVLDLDRAEMSDSEAEKIARLVDNYTGVGYENIIVVLKDE